MSKDFPTLEENIRVIVNDLGLARILEVVQPQEIAQTIDAKQLTQIAQSINPEQKDALLRALLLERLSSEEVETILKHNGKWSKATSRESGRKS